MKFELFDFQDETVNYLIDTVTDSKSKQKIVVNSPTGSGKTITLLSFIDEYLNSVDNDMIFIWLTPGQGNLEEQSRKKMEKFYPQSQTGDIHDVLLQGFNKGYTYFINWEMITNKNNRSLKETEWKNLYNRIAEAHRDHKNFLVIVDEEHLNNTSKANRVLNALNHKNEIRMSATTKEIPTAEYYEVPEEDVINSGLITRALYINEGITTEEIDDFGSETLYLINAANKKRTEIQKEYDKIDENVRPLVIIQFPNMSDDLIKFVEDHLETLGYTYTNGLVAKWLDNEHINIEGVTANNGKPLFILVKQALSTGWDSPRAKILVKLRENMNETFEIQTLGRIRRMPHAKHYDNDILDFCYLYTFDEKYKEKALQSGDAYEVRRLFKKEEVNVKLTKEIRNRDYDYVNEKEVLDKTYKYYIEKYKLEEDFNKNKIKLETSGYIFGTQVYNKYLSGKTNTLDFKKAEFNINEISHEVDTHRHGLDNLHAIDRIKKEIGVTTKKTRVILQHLFHSSIPSQNKILNLNNREWYAFVINNQDKLKEEFNKLASEPTYYNLELLPEIHKIPFSIPEEDFYRYSPNENDVQVYESNAFHDYDTSMTTDAFRSTSEQLFEYFCESNPSIKYFYKNGDVGHKYLSIVYTTNFNKEYLFYPDYILVMEDGSIWIIETKGGEIKERSKNIDTQVINKFNAFKEYAKEYNLNWGFVRDKNNKLYINNTEYTDKMNNPNWKQIDDVL